METAVVFSEHALYQNVRRLPVQIQQELNDYVNFLLAKYSKNTVRPRAGCMKGTFTMMSDDFNAPLDDFRDYQ
jgi:hypothetical protein